MTDYQSDLKITNYTLIGTNYKASLELTPTGDIALVSGHEKLCEQILRAMINDDTSTLFSLNVSRVTQRQINTLITLILRNFRQNQINDVKKYDPNFNGYYIYRKAAEATSDYAKVSNSPVSWRFTDNTVTNNVEYSYGITRSYKNVFESTILEKVLITPTRFASRKEIVIGKSFVAFPDNGFVTFYVDGIRYFKGSELLDQIESINIYQQESEPRRFNVQVLVKDLRGSQVSIATGRAATTGV